MPGGMLGENIVTKVCLFRLFLPWHFLLSAFRCHSRGAGRALLQGPVQPGTPEASRRLPPSVRWAVLPCRKPDPPQRCRQTSTGAQRRHSGPGPEGAVCHRPGQTGHRERPDQHAYTHGEWRCSNHGVQEQQQEILHCSFVIFISLLSVWNPSKRFRFGNHRDRWLKTQVWFATCRCKNWKLS